MFPKIIKCENITFMMSYVTLMGNAFYDFQSSKKMIDFINLRKNDKNFMEKIGEISFNNHWITNQKNPRNSIIKIEDDFFRDMTNLKIIRVHSFDILPKNAFKNLNRIKELSYSNNNTPNLKYLGFDDNNILHSLRIKSKHIDEHFFPKCNNLKDVSIESSVFSGDCFKNINTLRELTMLSNNNIYIKNFILISSTLSNFEIHSDSITTDNFNILIPNIVVVNIANDSKLLNKITKNSFRIKCVTCYDKCFHFSQLFNKTKLRRVEIINDDIYNENLLSFENNIKLNRVRVRKNKKMSVRDLPGNLKNIIRT